MLNAIDEYGRTKKYLMNVGDDKGKIVCNQIRERKPQVVLELGGYIGYSAILFGDAVRQSGGTKYFSVERNPVFAAVIMALVDLAGLSDIVKVVIGASAECIKRLHAETSLYLVDFMFLDHYKPAYTSDVKLCESLSLIRPGTVLAADNVIKPGNPPYLEYVRASVEDKRKWYAEGGSNSEETAAFKDRTKNQYKNRVSEEKLDAEQLGNPNLVYESCLVKSFEPTGIPVSQDRLTTTRLLTLAGRNRDHQVRRSIGWQLRRAKEPGSSPPAFPA